MKILIPDVEYLPYESIPRRRVFILEERLCPKYIKVFVKGISDIWMLDIMQLYVVGGACNVLKSSN
jgi:hypothetical protein